MEQLDFFDVPSPCIGVCSSDERGYCKGCMRNREERFAWQKLSSVQKKHVIRLCRQRYRRQVAKNAPTDGRTKPSDNDTSTQGELF